MRQAIALAQRGIGFTSPNPCVGALIVKHDRIIGHGYHTRAGEPHAEIEALRSSKEDIIGATMYVTLEPCTHQGKTPPCVPAIKDAGITRVVIGTLDSNPRVSGGGVSMLRDAGIVVKMGVEQRACDYLIRHFVHWVTTGLPAILCKVAMSADYKIAARRGVRTHITGEEAQQKVHALRHEVDAILVGAHTIVIDNPYLTDRSGYGESDPLRVIVDSELRSPLDANVFADSNCLVATTKRAPADRRTAFQNASITFLDFPEKSDGVSLFALLKHLGAKQITSVLVEGGQRTFDSFIRDTVINEWHIFQSPDQLGADGLDVCSDIKTFKSMMRNLKSVPVGRDEYFFSVSPLLQGNTPLDKR